MPPSHRSFAVIPAAGVSRRMGRPKLLLPFRGSTVIEQVLKAWGDSRVDHVLVIVRPDDTALADRVGAVGARAIIAPTAPPEMKDSVASGLAVIARDYAPRDTDAWLLAPADMPRLSAGVIDRVLDAYDPARPETLIASCGGRSGHPVLFPWSRAAEVRELAPDQGINALLHGSPAVPVEVRDPDIHLDLDTPDDYRRLDRRGGKP